MPKISEYPEITNLNDADQMLTESNGVYRRIAGANIKPKNSYRYEQFTPSTVWVITHNLGYRPGGIQVFDSAGTEWIGDVEHTDTNSLTVRFDAAFGGVAYLS